MAGRAIQGPQCQRPQCQGPLWWHWPDDCSECGPDWRADRIASSDGQVPIPGARAVAGPRGAPRSRRRWPQAPRAPRPMSGPSTGPPALPQEEHPHHRINSRREAWRCSWFLNPSGLTGLRLTIFALRERNKLASRIIIPPKSLPNRRIIYILSKAVIKKWLPCHANENMFALNYAEYILLPLKITYMINTFYISFEMASIRKPLPISVANIVLTILDT